MTLASYFSRSIDKDSQSNGKLFRTVSQRSYSCSVNSTSLNTCSSVCSMQPFNHSQQLPFRYFDSDMARKRPLVVSFRRIQKMTPNSLDSCGSVSICDIHRLVRDTKLRDNNEVMTMKIMSKCGSNPTRITMQRKGFCNESQSCRSFSSHDKQKSQLDSLFDENVFDPNHSDRGCAFPKEKFYGNAKLLLTMNDDILRKAVIDCDEDSYNQQGDMKQNVHRNIASTHHLTKDKIRFKNRSHFKPETDQNRLETITPTATVNRVMDDIWKIRKGMGGNNDYLLEKGTESEHRAYETLIAARHKQLLTNLTEYERVELPRNTLEKSSSVPTFSPSNKLSAFVEQAANEKTPERKSVSMLSIKEN